MIIQGNSKEISKKIVSIASADALRMKLKSIMRILFVSQGHDQSAVFVICRLTPSKRKDAFRKIVLIHHQRVIPHDLEVSLYLVRDVFQQRVLLPLLRV